MSNYTLCMICGGKNDNHTDECAGLTQIMNTLVEQYGMSKAFQIAESGFLSGFIKEQKICQKDSADLMGSTYGDGMEEVNSELLKKLGEDNV